MPDIVAKACIMAVIALCPSFLIEAASSTDGYPIANFSVTANAGCDGSLFGAAMINPGKLGNGLSLKESFLSVLRLAMCRCRCRL